MALSATDPPSQIVVGEAEDAVAIGAELTVTDMAEEIEEHPLFVTRTRYCPCVEAEY